MRCLVLAAIIFLFSPLVHSSQQLKFQGKAYDPDTAAFLYTELHSITLDDKGEYLESRVEYYYPNGEVFATKEVSFSDSRIAPSLKFYDHRVGSKMLVDRHSGSMSVTSQKGGVVEKNEVALDSSNQVVVDAGFDRFIYDNWEKLLEAKSVSFAFLAITRARLVDLEVVEMRRTQDSVVYEVQPSNFFFRLLVDPIELTYQLNTSRLLRFEGLTNIPRYIDGNTLGDNYVAVIEYEYFE